MPNITPAPTTTLSTLNVTSSAPSQHNFNLNLSNVSNPSGNPHPATPTALSWQQAAKITSGQVTLKDILRSAGHTTLDPDCSRHGPVEACKIKGSQVAYYNYSSNGQFVSFKGKCKDIRAGGSIYLEPESQRSIDLGMKGCWRGRNWSTAPEITKAPTTTSTEAPTTTTTEAPTTITTEAPTTQKPIPACELKDQALLKGCFIRVLPKKEGHFAVLLQQYGKTAYEQNNCKFTVTLRENKPWYFFLFYDSDHQIPSGGRRDDCGPHCEKSFWPTECPQNPHRKFK